MAAAREAACAGVKSAASTPNVTSAAACTPYEIQVHVQNLVFRVLLFQLQREVNFLQLAGNRLLTGQVGELNQLLGNGGCALTERAVADVGEHGADDARDVKARMLVEAQILRSKERIHDVRGQTRRVDDRAVLLADK